MNQLNKLIEQLENTLDSARKMYHNSEQWYSEPEYNDTYEMRLNKCFDDLKAFASRPTCGVEQRKFLDVLGLKGKFSKTNYAVTVGEDDDSLILGSDFYLLDVARNQKDYVDLQKVLKGE